MRCLGCGTEIAERAQVCARCGSWAPVEYLLYVGEDRPAEAPCDAPGSPAPPASGASVGQQSPESAPDPDVDDAVLAEWVETLRFSVTRLRPGYDQEEVDAFLNAVRESFLGVREPSLTPDEIRAMQFSTTHLRPGYDEEEVDAFLDEAESRLAAQLSARRKAPAACGAARPTTGDEIRDTTFLIVGGGHHLAQARDGQAMTEDDTGWGNPPDPDADGAVLAEWVETSRFSGTRLRPGYDQEEVDAFLNAIHDSFLGVRAPSLTPDQIRAMQFSTTHLRPGYDEEEVDAFLDEAESRLAAQVAQSGEQPQDEMAGQPQIDELELDADSLPIQTRPATSQTYLIATACLVGGLVSVGLAAAEIAEYAHYNRVGNLAIVGMVIGALAGLTAAAVNDDLKPPGWAHRINTVAAWLAVIGGATLLFLYGALMGGGAEASSQRFGMKSLAVGSGAHL